VGALSEVDIQKLSEQLDVDGYAVLRGVVSKDKLEEFRLQLMDRYERLRQTGQLFKGGGMLTGHLNCYPGAGSRFIYDEIRDFGIVDVARARDPRAAERPRATLNFNLPGSVAQHYHADGLYTESFLICNVAVVDTDLVNGAIDVLPGTNRQFYKFWQYALERKYRLSTRVPIDQGDAILRMSTTWHRGMPNLSDAPRPMAAITFGESSAPLGDPYLEHDGEVVFYPNWYSTSRLGRLRERTFKAAPITYSSYRFVTSLRGNKGYASF
jgi:hypothetical protein